MKPIIETLGKVVPTVEGNWNIKNKYSEISIVFDEQSNKSYISKKEVPVGISILNKEYWQCFGNTRIDSDSILILSHKNDTGYINSFTLKEAIDSINIEDRRLGLFISFYEKPMDSNGVYRWNLYQFNSNNVDNFSDISAWDSIYYNRTKFYGLLENEDILYKVKKNPGVGDYAFVGTSLGEAIVYRCYTKNIWKKTKEKATEYLTILIKGTVTVGSNGNWFNNGVDTGISAKGEKGDKPYLRYNSDTGYIEYSFDLFNWVNLVNKEEVTAAATVEIGEVIYEKGIHPNVENVGTKASAILDFKLPDTNTVNIGTTTTTAPGTKAKVTNGGTAFDAIFNFSIPMGNTGAKGEKGDGWECKGFVDNVDNLPSSDQTVGDLYLVGTTAPYDVYVYKGSSYGWVNIGNALEIKASVIDGGRADSKYGGARTFDCGGADAY